MKIAELKDKLDTLPAGPGVYLMRDAGGKVIYVGKAKDLRARVRAYLRGGDGRPHVVFLMRQADDIETLVTGNEKEALILENNLIKQYKPRYNIRLKDDKSYLSIKVTAGAWPRVLATRSIVRDGSRYFGPYASAVAVRDTLDVIEKHFLLRSCTDYNFRNRDRPCLQFQIKRCPAPCVLPVDAEEYAGNLRQAVLFIEGKSADLLRQLQGRMRARADALEFEQAARLRDRIRAVEKTLEKQRMVSHWGADQDIFGLYREGGFIEVQVIFVRQGKLTGNQAYSFEDHRFDDDEVVAALLAQFYQGSRFIPDEVLAPVELEDRAVHEEYLAERKGRKVALRRPRRGVKHKLLEMAMNNARQSFSERHDQEREREKMLRELQQRLRLRRYPQRIECYDISMIQGTHAVGSRVSFFDGQPDKRNYRRYRVRTVGPETRGDDFAMMYEVVQRRFRRGLQEMDVPDLMVVDGGKGQLQVALTALADLGVKDVEVVALAKTRVTASPRQAEVQRSEERVFLPARSNPVVLRRNSNALFLLQRLRDEAHRFAITYHRTLRTRETLGSGLDRVPGVGPARRRALLRRFGSLKRLREASMDELLEVPSITRPLARRIVDGFRAPGRT